MQLYPAIDMEDVSACARGNLKILPYILSIQRRLQLSGRKKKPLFYIW